jgi:putative transposase
MRAAREHRGGERSVTATPPLRLPQRARPPRAPLSEIAQKTVAGATGAERRFSDAPTKRHVRGDRLDHGDDRPRTRAGAGVGCHAHAVALGMRIPNRLCRLLSSTPSAGSANHGDAVAAALQSKHTRLVPPFRKTRRSYDDGGPHFLTFSCYRRLPLLNRDRSRTWLIDAVLQARSKDVFDLWAWVAMPEHVHLVLLPHRDVRVATILSAIKQSVSKRAIRWLRENAPDYLDELLDRQPSGALTHRFWQRGGGYDRNLRSVRDVHEKIAYVHDNPIRRGLVARAADWEWSSAGAWATGGATPLPIDRHSVPPLTLRDESIDGPFMRRND